MKITDFPEANILVKGGKYNDVPACLTTLDGEEGLICRWEPTEEELCHIMSEGGVYVGFVGNMSPHLVFGGNPFEHKTPSTLYMSILKLAQIEQLVGLDNEQIGEQVVRILEEDSYTDHSNLKAQKALEAIEEYDTDSQNLEELVHKVKEILSGQ